jgi:hypothetical protein
MTVLGPIGPTGLPPGFQPPTKQHPFKQSMGELTKHTPWIRRTKATKKKPAAIEMDKKRNAAEKCEAPCLFQDLGKLSEELITMMKLVGLCPDPWQVLELEGNNSYMVKTDDGALNEECWENFYTKVKERDEKRDAKLTSLCDELIQSIGRGYEDV